MAATDPPEEFVLFCDRCKRKLDPDEQRVSFIGRELVCMRCLTPDEHPLPSKRNPPDPREEK
jgi:hypothetical protein